MDFLNQFQDVKNWAARTSIWSSPAPAPGGRETTSIRGAGQALMSGFQGAGGGSPAALHDALGNYADLSTASSPASSIGGPADFAEEDPEAEHWAPSSSGSQPGRKSLKQLAGGLLGGEAAPGPGGGITSREDAMDDLPIVQGEVARSQARMGSLTRQFEQCQDIVQSCEANLEQAERRLRSLQRTADVRGDQAAMQREAGELQAQIVAQRMVLNNHRAMADGCRQEIHKQEELMRRQQERLDILINASSRGPHVRVIQSPGA